MKKLVLMVLTGMLCAAASTVALAQKPNPDLKTTKNVKVFLPDLVVSDVAIGNAADGIVQNVKVTVKNTCEAAAPSSYVLLTFKNKEGNPLHVVGNTVKALKGSESVDQVFVVSAKNMPSGSHVSVEVDPFKTLKEDVEGNNFRRLNPNMAPFPDGPTHCQPKG
jgi:hypothetical protein